MPETPLWPYVTIFAMLVGAGIGVPIPEELPVVTAGVMVGHPDTHIHWWVMLPLCILGVVASDVLLYGIGRWWGPRLLQYRWVKSRLLPPNRLQKIEGNFHKYGVKILLFARVLPGIRSPIFVTAGIMRLPFHQFVLADGLYAIPGVTILFFLGYAFTDQIMEVVDRAEKIKSVVAIILLTVVATYLVIQFFKHPVSEGAPEQVPLIGPQLAGPVEHTRRQGDKKTGSPEEEPKVETPAQT